jgi:hypothetical protein
MGDGARRVLPFSPEVVARLCFTGVESVGLLKDGLVAVLGGGLGGAANVVGEVSICGWILQDKESHVMELHTLANEEPPRDNLRRRPVPLSL